VGLGDYGNADKLGIGSLCVMYAMQLTAPKKTAAGIPKKAQRATIHPLLRW